MKAFKDENPYSSFPEDSAGNDFVDRRAVPGLDDCYCQGVFSVSGGRKLDRKKRKNYPIRIDRAEISRRKIFLAAPIKIGRAHV
jgi:hypothetical protein